MVVIIYGTVIAVQVISRIVQPELKIRISIVLINVVSIVITAACEGEPGS